MKKFFLISIIFFQMFPLPILKGCLPAERKFIRMILILFFILQAGGWAIAQEIITTEQQEIDYANPKEYEIGGITVSGTELLDQNALIQLSGLKVGEKITIPGDATAEAIRKLWKQKLFSEIEISAIKIQGNIIFLDLKIKEQPRMSRFSFEGVKKSEADNLREKINLYKEKIVTQNLLKTTETTVKEYFVDKGFLNAEVNVTQKTDTAFRDHVALLIDVKKNKKVRITEIVINGNEEFSEAKIKRAMKETKEKGIFHPFDNFEMFAYTSLKDILLLRIDSLISHSYLHFKNRLRLRIFKQSKFMDENYEKDKEEIIAKYNDKGFRDAKIIQDTVYKSGESAIGISITINEGKKYYFRNITWVGNTKYSAKVLSDILGIEKGNVYSQSKLEKRLYMNPDGRDVSSLYMDDGYLFFQLTPVETTVSDDSIDLEIRIYEGQQATINKILVTGNTKTNDHVIIREIRTKPGQLFSRADIIRTQRELAQLGYFDQEKLNVTPHPNPTDGTVDIEYIVEEKPSDQIELSGGWGGGRVVGTLGVSFSNFSTRNILKKDSWSPLPSGDGQRLSLRGQTNGLYYQSYNISFTEPWLGGRKPNSFSIAAWHSIQSNGVTKVLKKSSDTKTFWEPDSILEGKKVSNPLRQDIQITGVSLSLGKRLTRPDDYFTLMQELSYQKYRMHQWFQFIFPDGESNVIFYKVTLSRNSIDAPIYPRSGSQLSASLQLTPPYSFINSQFLNKDTDYSLLPAADRYKFAEYHKWKFTAQWYNKLVGDLVLSTKVGYGFLGYYNKQIGEAPFEHFYLGGSGLTGYALDGREIIALRGYDDQSVSPRTGGTIISKYTMELRYPLSLNPSATIYGLTFLEAGSTWNRFKDFNPFAVQRSAGAGVRIFLPMFGMLGLDWGYRFDDTTNKFLRPQSQKSQVHFTIGFNLGEL